MTTYRSPVRAAVLVRGPAPLPGLLDHVEDTISAHHCRGRTQSRRPEPSLGGTVQPETRYAKSGDVHIAYQVIGEGPPDLVLVPGFVSHLDLGWDDPATVHVRERLGSFTRLIRFDKRGTGTLTSKAGACTP